MWRWVMNEWILRRDQWGQRESRLTIEKNVQVIFGRSVDSQSIHTSQPADERIQSLSIQLRYVGQILIGHLYYDNSRSRDSAT